MTKGSYVVVGVLLLSGAPGAFGQVILGRVQELGTDEIVGEAALTIIGASGQRIALSISDSSGTFVLKAPAADSFRVRVERLGYAATESVLLALSPRDTLRLEIRLRPEPVRLEALTASADAARLNTNVQGFARRLRNGFGRYLGPSDLINVRANASMDVLARIGGSMLQWDNTGRLMYARRMTPSLSGESLCTPRVYVDGSLITETVQEGAAVGRRGRSVPMVPVDWYVRASEIRGVEVYRRPREAPPQYQGAMGVGPDGRDSGECPVVLIWTDHGFGWNRR